MNDSLGLNEILADLAKGKINIAEAERQIDALKTVKLHQETDTYGRPQSTNFGKESFTNKKYQTGDTDEEDQEDMLKSRPKAETGSEYASGAKGINCIKVQSIGKRVRLIKDNQISTVSVEGQHILRKIGDTIEIRSNGEVGPSFQGFSIINPPRNLEDFRNIGLGRELVVKVNPKILVDVEITGGSLKSSGVRHFGRVRITAGSVNLEDVYQVTDLLIQAGGATISGPIQAGRSRLRAESGNITLNLSEGANVTIHGQANLGKISWPDGFGSVDELVIGNGAAKLDVSVVMGWVSIRSEESENHV